MTGDEQLVPAVISDMHRLAEGYEDGSLHLAAHEVAGVAAAALRVIKALAEDLNHWLTLPPHPAVTTSSTSPPATP